MACQKGERKAAGRAKGIKVPTEGKYLDRSLAPMSAPDEIFVDMVSRCKPALSPLFARAVELNVATICSGTDAPIFALKLLEAAARDLGEGAPFNINHIFSCEIEPFKQAFIRRNVGDSVTLFRDVVMLANNTEALTAGGWMADVPQDKIDILFSGCSCVDYSSMNNTSAKELPQAVKSAREKSNKAAPVELDLNFLGQLQESLSEASSKAVGESNRTFLAALVYIAKARPKIVILENVSGAPWEQYTQFWFPKVGYAASFVRLDSKNYYIPQTRMRGYLIAVDASCFDGTAERIAKSWATAIGECSRRASSSVTDFLLDVDDPRLLRARAEMDQPRERTRESDWAICRLRHDTIRQSHGIPRRASPFSSKIMSGLNPVYLKFPSQAWSKWLSSQTGRVIDYLDISYFLAAQLHMDLMFKTTVLDVSQNIDRSTVITSMAALGAKFGLISCITPAGLPFVTDLMRPVTGIEALMLQGMPMDSVSLSTETQLQLQDLAGNAMSVPVVGAAIIAALSSVARLDPSKLAAAQTYETASRDLETANIYPDTIVIDSGNPSKDLVRVPETSLEPAAFDSVMFWSQLGTLMRSTQRGQRMCFCPQDMAQEPLRCQYCGDTACRACEGNPRHNYTVVHRGPENISPERVASDARASMPSAFTLHVSTDHLTRVLGGRTDDTSRLILDALARPNTFYLSSVKVTAVTTLAYKSSMVTARLVAEPDRTDFFIFLARSYYLADTSSYRKSLLSFDFSQPIARGSWVTSLRADVLEFFVWVHEHAEFSLPMAWSGRQDEPLTIGHIPDGHIERKYRELVAKINSQVPGIYQHKPQCGTAENWLWSKGGEKALFLFKDCTRTGHPHSDGFVWATDTRKLENHEHRNVVLHADRRFAFSKGNPISGTTSVFIRGLFANCGRASLSTSSVGVQSIAFHALDKFAGMTPTPSPTGTMVLVKVDAALVEFPANTAFTNKLLGLASYVMPTWEYARYRRVFGFVAGDVARAYISSRNTDQLGVQLPGIPNKSYLNSILEKPRITWTATLNSGIRKEPCEDPRAASRYEANLARLPSALSQAARISKADRQDNWSISGNLEFTVMANLQVLGSRALANLLSTKTLGRELVANRAVVTSAIQFCYCSPSNPVFGDLYQCLADCKNLTGIDLGVPMVNVSEYGAFPVSGLTLRKDQSEAVEWLVAREMQPEPFPETEVEEEVDTALGVRVSSKAVHENSGTMFTARGGVAAHEIGFGKTVVTLGLIWHQLKYDRGNSIKYRKAMDPQWAEHLRREVSILGQAGAETHRKDDEFFFHTSISLVIVPTTVTKQWASEASRFLGPNVTVMVVKRLTDLRKHLLSTLQETTILIVSFSLLASDDYENHILQAAWSGDGQPPSCEREREDVYRRAVNHLRLAVAAYNRRAVEQGACFSQEAAEVEARELLKSLRQAEKDDQQQVLSGYAPRGSRKGYRAEKSQADQEIPRPPKRTRGPKGRVIERREATGFLENFSFARVIFDEYTYLDTNNYNGLFLKYVNSRSKWLLSGTLGLDALADAARIGEFLGIHVAAPDPRLPPGLPEITRGLSISPLSSSEDFRQLLGPVRSVDMALQRHDQGRLLVKHFIRRNPTDYSHITIKTHVTCESMSRTRHLRYLLTSMELKDTNDDFFGLDGSTRGQLTRVPENNRTGQSVANELLVTLASRPHVESDEEVSAYLDERMRLKRQEVKRWADKTMWLRGWISLLNNNLPRRQWNEPERVAVDRVDYWFNTYWFPDLTAADYADRCGRVAVEAEREALGLRQLAHQVGPADYSSSLGNMTWLDFFVLDASDFRQLKELPEKATLELAVCLVSLDCQMPWHLPPAQQLAPTLGHIQYILEASVDDKRPAKTEAQMVQARRETEALGDTGKFRDLIQQWARAKRTPHMGQDLLNLSAIELRQKCRQRNLKCSTGEKVANMRAKLHDHNIGASDRSDYRDGRGCFNRYNSLPLSAKSAAKELNEAFTSLHRAIYDLGVCARERQLWGSMQQRTDNEPTEQECAGAGCVSRDIACILAACGHLVCASCAETTRETGFCVDNSCGCFFKDRPILSLPLPPQPAHPDKIAMLVCHLKQIPRNEFILVFVQYAELCCAATSALEEMYGTTGFSNLVSFSGDMDSATILENFKAGKGGQVLLMDIDSVASAGSNLTIANHIIFATPYMHASLRGQRATIEQAKGRCIREGQDKIVHIYHLAMKGTVEEKELRTIAGWDSQLREALVKHYQERGGLPWWDEDEEWHHKVKC